MIAEVTEERVSCADGKYTVVLRSDGSAQALRYGEFWPGHGDTLHDNLTLALARDLSEARHRLNTTVPDEVVKALEVARGLFPSAAGLKDHAPQHVIAFYVNLGELRAVKSLIDTALQTIKGNGQ